MGLSFGNWDTGGDEAVSGTRLNEMGLTTNALYNQAGLTPPQKTTAQILAVVTPATGLTFTNTTENDIWFYNGTEWVSIGGTSGGSGSFVGAWLDTTNFLNVEVFNGI
jgi:hypothetical protein